MNYPPGALMWACPDCGREHEKLYDARWNCACRSDPNAALAAKARRTMRLILIFLSLALHILLGLGIGTALGPLVFIVAGVPAGEGLEPGAAIGVLVGSIW